MRRTIVIFGSGRLLQLLSSFMLAKWFGPQAWGSVSTIRSLTELPLLLGRGGAEQLLLRSSEPWVVGRQVVAAMSWCYLISAAALVAVYIVLPGHKSAATVIGLYVLGVMFLADIQLASALQSVAGTHAALVADQIVLPFLRVALAMGFSLIADGALAIALSFATSSVIAWTRTNPRLFDFSLPSPKVMRQVVDLGSNYVLASLFSRVDTLVASLVLGLGDAGRYAILIGMASMLTAVGQTQARLVGPRIGRFFSTQQDGTATASYTANLQKICFAVSVCLATLAIPCTYYLPALVGREFRLDPTTILLVYGAFVINASFAFEGFFLSLGGLQQKERGLLLLAGVVLGTASFSGATHFGLQGCAGALAISSVFLISSRRFVVRNSLNAAMSNALKWTYWEIATAAFTSTVPVGIALFLYSDRSATEIAIATIFLSACQVAVAYNCLFSPAQKENMTRRRSDQE